MKHFAVMGISVGIALCVWATPGFAQTTPCTPAKTVVNRVGNKAAITIGATAVNAIDANSTRCQVLLRNTGAAPMSCLPVSQGTPTATDGLIFAAGDQLLMGTEGKEAWKCIRTTGTSTTASTVEGLP